MQTEITIRVDVQASAWATFDKDDNIIGKWNSCDSIEQGEKAARHKARLMGCDNPRILTVKSREA